MIDDRLERDLSRAARPGAPDPGVLVEEIVARRQHRTRVRRLRAGAVAVAIVLVAFGAFVVLQAQAPGTLAPATGGLTAPPAVAPPLRLGQPTCRVTWVPITVDGSHGFAYVATITGDEGCPTDGDQVVAVDIDGDGRADAVAGPFGDCQLGCEAWAAPDLNGDGSSDVAVAHAGADGYGIDLYAVTGGANPSIRQLQVSDPTGKGFLPAGPLQVGWVDVAARFAGARCDVEANGTHVLLVDNGDKLGASAQVQTTTLEIDGDRATVADTSTDTMPLAQAPLPGTELCGAPTFAGVGGDAAGDQLVRRFTPN
ncbi:MAG TPA: hypothetical protein VK646_10390 [Actinomycetota bacterium]|nr:hypothetical protein [Actinomycetota bacterium]